MKKWVLIVLISILFVVIFSIVAFVYLSLNTSQEKQELENPGVDIVSPIIQEQHVSYLLNEMGAWKLHNSPLSANKPVIEVNISDDIFTSEVDSGKIITIRGKKENPDIIITTSKEEILKAFNSSSVLEFIKNSVSSNKMILETKAGYANLFSKGYLVLYKDLTGQNLAGNVIRIFSG